MSRFLSLALAACLLLVSACKIQRTPEEYIDPAATDERGRVAATEELRARLAALAGALTRRSLGTAVSALAPAADVQVVTPAGTVLATGDSALVPALRWLLTDEGVVEVREMQVTLTPRATVAWFAALVEIVDPRETVEGEPADPNVLRATGVYVLNEGTWQLTQLHLSRAVAEDTVPAETAEE